MSMLTSLRDRVSGPRASGSGAADADADAVDDPQAPFEGYDRLDGTEVANGMAKQTQVELEAVERYERAHKNREEVLGKLRYMRQSEPMPGYDALSSQEVVSALGEADLATIKRVRGYERKFQNRRLVVDEVVRVHRERRGNTSAPAR